MTDAQQSQADAIERDRKRREDELWLLLLLLLIATRRDMVALIAHGHDPMLALSNRILGNGTNMPGAAYAIAESMADAHRDGYRRAGLLAGVRLDRNEAGTIEDLLPLYFEPARQAAQAMTDTLTQAVAAAMVEAQAAGTSLVKAVRQAFADAGYTKSNSSAIEMGVARAIVAGHSGGMLTAFNMAGLKVLGVKYVAVRDDKTTVICKAYDGVQLPPDHGWLATHTPPNHFNCRSLLLPLFRQFEVTDDPPYDPPPMVGFGRAVISYAAA